GRRSTPGSACGGWPGPGRRSTPPCARRSASRPAPRPPRQPCGWTASRAGRPTGAGPRGSTGGKKGKGRKRVIGVDSLGLVWALSVLTADVQERDGGCWLLAAARRFLPRVREVIADSAFSRRFVEFVRAVCRWAVTVTRKAADGFVVQPRRWVVERTFGWFLRYRRPMGDYEFLPETSGGVMPGALTPRMLRRVLPTP